VSNSFLAKISSSLAEFAEPHTAAGEGALLQRLIAVGLLRATYSRQAFHQLATNLIRIAEHSIAFRDMQTLAPVSEILVNFALPEARQAGTYYQALVMKRRGQTDEARVLLEEIAESPSTRHRARAMQTLGVMHHEHSELDEAGRFYLEAIRVGAEHDLISAISPRLTISALKSMEGDHRGALADLEDLLPLTRLVVKQHPFYFYVYHNALAVELTELGRLIEAEAACAIALASPFAHAYPEHAETRDEIAAKRVSATPSVVAVRRMPEAAPSPQAEPERKSKPFGRLAFSWPAHKRDSFQRSIIPIPATATIAFNAISILDRALICIGPRAPPTHKRRRYAHTQNYC
jgi:tetratricopeptide (TPR) repeat protein